jgi:superfamily II RNA helicase
MGEKGALYIVILGLRLFQTVYTLSDHALRPIPLLFLTHCLLEGESNVVKIIRTIKDKDMVPCIVFSFSRKDCEAYATSMKDMDFNDGSFVSPFYHFFCLFIRHQNIAEASKELVLEIFNNAMDLLSEDDRKLPQVSLFLHFCNCSVSQN